MQIRELPDFKRPREKLLTRGAATLTDAELLAVILGTGYHGRSALEVAQQLLKHRSLSELLALSTQELRDFRGLGLAKVAILQSIKAMIDRHSSSAFTVTITTPDDAVPLIAEIKNKKQEYLIALYLDARSHLLARETITIGLLDSSLIHPREVFAPALSHRAAMIILAHNHPSGDPHPSEEDILTTQRLASAGELLDIPIIDHLIVAPDSWRSLKQLNLL